MSVGMHGTLPPPSKSRLVCGQCRAPREFFHARCDECDWRLDERCPDCDARYPRVPGYDALRFHRKACPKRGLAQTLQNLVRMYDNARAGRPCARYIRDQEWAHLLGFTGGKR